MFFRDRGQNIPVVAQALFGRPVGYRFALNFKKAGVLTYDTSPLRPTAELQGWIVRVILR
jgi:hypothetical protein